jgi:hypothetical protein
MRLEEWTSPAGKRRILTRMEPRERRAYALAAALAFPRPPEGPASFGSPRPGHRSTWFAERRRWRAAVHARTMAAASIVVSDVAACYPSIGEAAIRMAARQAGGDPGALLRVLARYREAGGDGIPIGPAESGPIAEAVLALADERARLAGCLPVRWVDDVVFAGDPGAVHRAWRAWTATLGELGLREHEGKRSTNARAIGGRGSFAGGDRRDIMRGS